MFNYLSQRSQFSMINNNVAAHTEKKSLAYPNDISFGYASTTFGYISFGYMCVGVRLKPGVIDKYSL